MKAVPSSVRPPAISVEGRSGLRAAVDDGVMGRKGAEVQQAVFPIEDGDGKDAEELCANEEEEDVVCPPCLPTPYQPTRS